MKMTGVTATRSVACSNLRAHWKKTPLRTPSQRNQAQGRRLTRVRSAHDILSLGVAEHAKGFGADLEYAARDGVFSARRIIDIPQIGGLHHR